MGYIEKKTISKKTYYYFTTNQRVNGKFKKVRRYLGTAIPTALAGKTNPVRVARHLTKREALAIDTIQKHYSARHPLDKKLWGEERERLVSFIYNTNAIEGNTLTLKETDSVLKGKFGPAQRKERDVREVQNMKRCIDFLFEHGGELDEEMILKLHFIEQEGIMADAGRYRGVDVRVGNYICPPHVQVPRMMQELVIWYGAARKKLHPFELSSRLHLKFVRVHPFRDGNGRMARLLANFVLLKNGYPLLNIFNDKKVVYYLELQKFDIDHKERAFVKYLVEVFVNQYSEYWK